MFIKLCYNQSQLTGKATRTPQENARNQQIPRIGAAIVTVAVFLFAIFLIADFPFGSYLVCMFLPIGYIMTAAGFHRESAAGATDSRDCGTGFFRSLRGIGFPSKTEMKLLLKKSTGFLECESEAEREYGRGFYEVAASDLNYKQRFIHSFKCVYMLKDSPLFKESDFEHLRGKIQVLLPEKDIFKKEDQDRLAELFRKLDAEILSVPGGHVGFIVQSECYIDLMEKFLEKL